MLHNIRQPDVNLRFLCVVKPVVPRCSVPEAVTVGTSTELRCLENEGFPAPQYRWFHNNEELPQDPKNSAKFANSSYSINPDTGGLVQRWQASCCCYIYDFIISVPIVCKISLEARQHSVFTIIIVKWTDVNFFSLPVCSVCRQDSLVPSILCQSLSNVNVTRLI